MLVLYIYLNFFIISKDDFTKVKSYLNLIHDCKQLYRLKQRLIEGKVFRITRYPILLKKDSCFTDLIVSNAHATVFCSTINLIHSS